MAIASASTFTLFFDHYKNIYDLSISIIIIATKSGCKLPIKAEKLGRTWSYREIKAACRVQTCVKPNELKSILWR